MNGQTPAMVAISGRAPSFTWMVVDLCLTSLHIPPSAFYQLDERDQALCLAWRGLKNEIDTAKLGEGSSASSGARGTTKKRRR